MSVRNTVRAFPTLLRVGFSEAVAYRAELLVWVLATTMPLVMLALWSAVAREAPIGRFGQTEFVAYFLADFIVRQLTGSWASWQLSFEVRTGTLSMRLLRPIHPLMAYAAEQLAALPMRLIVAIPVAAILLWQVGAGQLPHSAGMWGLWLLAMVGGWLITFLANVAIGCLALFMESSLKVMDAWVALFFVFSGYLIPVELFPPGLRAVTNWLPFRYQIGFGVELLTSGYANAAATVPFFLRQWMWIAILLGLTLFIWRRGLKRFGAYGG